MVHPTSDIRHPTSDIRYPISEWLSPFGDARCCVSTLLIFNFFHYSNRSFLYLPLALCPNLERRWWQRYLARRDPAAYLRDKRAYWHRTLAELNLRPPPAGTRVLDAGCGPAGIFTILPDQQVTALDPLLPAYARDLPHFDPADYPNVTFVTGTLEDPPPLGEPFP